MTRRALLVDYGGVLTRSVGRSFRDFERAEGMPKGSILRLLQAAYEADQDANPIARYERGELDRDTFERLLVAQLADAGYRVGRERLVARLFAGMQPHGAVWDLVAQTRAGGVRTVLLSNSWGTEEYPRQRLAEVFDELVISGEVGMRKPSPAIYLLAADRAGVPPEACAFVDDLERNVEVARQLGMHGVLHREAERTARALSSFLELDLEVAAAE